MIRKARGRGRGERGEGRGERGEGRGERGKGGSGEWGVGSGLPRCEDDSCFPPLALLRPPPRRSLPSLPLVLLLSTPAPPCSRSLH